MTRVAVLAAAVTALGLAERRATAQPPVESREVRQLVTFRFLPGQARAALEVYRTGILPVYRGVESMRTVRLLGEVESPEPLDLVVVTHYADMAGMDRANQSLRSLPPDSPTIGQLYQQVADLSLGHHDQFVEVISPPVSAAAPDGLLEVLEFVRVVPGAQSAFERQILQFAHQWEQDSAIRQLVPRTETARFLVADGWDYLRSYAVRDLAAWQAYSTARARHPAMYAATRLVAERKTMILRELPDMRVR
jgi:hypothetical protein